MNERQQVFNALNGVELRKYILSQIEKKLEQSNEFPEGLTFPWVRWNVSVLSYPQQDIEAEPKFKIMDEEGEAPEKDTPGVISINFEEVVDTPDKARVESNQPVPTIQPGPGLGPQKGQVLVDKSILTPKVPSKK